MEADMVGLSFIILGIFLFIGKWLRVLIPLFQRLFLPSSLIAGLLALIVGPEVLGQIFDLFTSEDFVLQQGFIPEEVLLAWEELPGLFINIVFASLFIGKDLPSIRKMWDIGGAQVVMGQLLSWGQYVIGLVLVIFILTPIFDVNPLVAGLIEISFVGGHGTAAGLAGTFNELGLEEGTDLALGLATVGVLSGVIIGIIFINWGARTGKAQEISENQGIKMEEETGIIEFDDREPAAQLTTKPESVEALSIHFAYIGIAIGVGAILLEGLVQLEQFTWGAWTDIELMVHVPLFPLAMVGSIIVQILSNLFDKYNIIDRGMINRISGFSLDILIVSALGTVSITAIGDNFVPFIILGAAGLIWNVLAFLYLAPKMIPTNWFERGIGDFGQATGISATGLLLIRIADPQSNTTSLEGFGYKQILFEPLVGGGLFTAASTPLIAQLGPVTVLIIAGIVTIAWLLIGIFYFGRKNKG
ncbi:sodium/glutamate symporter [Natranaerobius thermophilus]|uniref:Sodium/glutamate symporter n=1 Tax=Natranaerobius thermophilus (strain ATCC BAA-1301 / DSM 18059 / JW/NM-WN-LF) TaxID=457570 RepID=B2A435_NATTJ|nr:sodium/glutamate symporter [Natranaerobius thermophilus]ACB85137.1 sodium/glutamate symporter [Natranaerobius thermophilus JW/NM-WN-LF]